MALDFDLTCTARLQIYDVERETAQLEAMSLGALSGALGGHPAPNKPVLKKTPEGSF